MAGMCCCTSTGTSSMNIRVRRRSPACGRRDAACSRPESALAIVDHVNPTAVARSRRIADPEAARQVDYLGENCAEFGIEVFGLLDPRQGIEHVVVPEQGMALPGMVIACGDSHTTTYGALGVLGFGIGTSDVEHVLATQTVVYERLRNLRIRIDGVLPLGVTAKDIVMTIIRRIGVSGATGFAVEFDGAAVRALDVAGRMTICNMIVEAGARGALISPDETVFDFLHDKPRTPRGAAWAAACQSWRLLHSDGAAGVRSRIADRRRRHCSLGDLGYQPGSGDQHRQLHTGPRA